MCTAIGAARTFRVLSIENRVKNSSSLIFAADFSVSLVLFLPFFTPLGSAFKCFSFENPCLLRGILQCKRVFILVYFVAVASSNVPDLQPCHFAKFAVNFEGFLAICLFPKHSADTGVRRR